MERTEAIQIIAEDMLGKLTPDEAVKAIRGFFNDFVPDDLRPQLDPSLTDQHDRHDIPPNIVPFDPRYRPALLHQMKRRLRGVTNAYLSAYLYGNLKRTEPVTGRMTELLACPVCDYKSLPIRGNWDVCPVCGWKSDPVQEAVPDEPVGANNVSLSQARAHFARTGVSAEDVRGRVDPHGKYKYPRAERTA